MLLSPIFLALGVVATSVLNARGRFAASAIAPIVYNLAIIGGTILLAPSLGVDGLAIGVVAGSIGHLLVQLPPTRAARVSATTATDRSARPAGAAGARAHGAAGDRPRRDPDHVRRRDRARVDARRRRVTAFNIAFPLLQIPLGVIGVPLGIVLLPSLSRDAAAGRPEEYAGLRRPGPAAARVRHAPDRGSRHRAAQRDVGAAVRPRPVHRRDRGRDRGGARGAAARTRRPLDDRRPRPGVLRPPGHANAGRRRARRGRPQLRAVGHPQRPATGCAGSASRSRSAPGSRRRFSRDPARLRVQELSPARRSSSPVSRPSPRRSSPASSRSRSTAGSG